MTATLAAAIVALSYETPFEVRKNRLQAQSLGVVLPPTGVSYRGMSAFL